MIQFQWRARHVASLQKRFPEVFESFEALAFALKALAEVFLEHSRAFQQHALCLALLLVVYFPGGETDDALPLLLLLFSDENKTLETVEIKFYCFAF